VLQKRNVDLQPGARGDDLTHVMSHPRVRICRAAPRHRSLAVMATRQRTVGRRSTDLSIGHLAHQLNSLLDGSIRCMQLALTAMDHSSPTADPDDAVRKLQTAQHTMRKMAEILERIMSAPSPAVDVFDEQQSLEAQILHIISTLQPLAAAHRVTLAVDLTPKVKSLPTRMLGPVILNGLRNSIEACAGSSEPTRRVELSIALNSAGELLILICDNGSGPPETSHAQDSPDASEDPDDCATAAGSNSGGGHGLGLDLSRRIVSELGGDLRLMSVPFGSGAILQVVVPLRRLVKHG
jgi:two-component system, NtrC family, C4-dicarboxylate transport sensor histidine kinase DctB